MRRSPDGGQSFPAKYQRRLTTALPDRPATVPTFDQKAGTGRLLVADLDTSRARALGVADPTARVALEAAALTSLIETCGGRAVTDVSPSGGRHVYLLFAETRPWFELRELAVALSKRFPTIDIGPMNGPGAQIRPPGAPHKLVAGTGTLSGWMRLTTPIAEAVAVLNRPCGPEVWARLHTELAVELTDYLPARPDSRSCATAQVASPATFTPGGRPIAVDDNGDEWLPRPGGRRNPRPDLAEIATYGTWQSRYPSPSEARLAVLNSIASAGWRLSEVIAEMEHGQWGGLKELLRRRRACAAAVRLKGDWQKAIDGLQAGNPASYSDTSPTNLSTPPLPPPALVSAVAASSAGSGLIGGKQDQSGQVYIVDSLADRARTAEPILNIWQQILRWNSAVWLAERDEVRRLAWGKAAPSIRLLLRAMAVAARKDGSATPAFGVRNLSLMCGLDHSTVAALLKLLREESDPLIERIVIGRGKAGDRYLLVVPEAYREYVAWRRWRGGRIDTTHPGLHHLGASVALVHEVLSSAATGSSEIARLALVSRASATRALRTLAALQLAVREPDGWVRGERDLNDVAAETGANLEQTERLATIQAERKIWHEVVKSWELPAYERPDHIERRIARDPSLAAATDVPWPTEPADASRLLPPDDERLPIPAPEVAALLDMDGAVTLLEQMLGAQVLPAPRRPSRTQQPKMTSAAAAWPAEILGRPHVHSGVATAAVGASHAERAADRPQRRQLGGGTGETGSGDALTRAP
ncbi:hypothetical protein ACFV1N_25105 [Streptosporangium canum]|uniref:hypothetical protein n=1 Tax=Streptosporangium canum TaxID=324952 RepID=UPI0036811137